MCNKVAGYKIDTQKPSAFLYTINEQSERAIRKAILFKMTSKIKISSNKFNEVKYLYNKKL
jgi:hypothetical protein